MMNWKTLSLAAFILSASLVGVNAIRVHIPGQEAVKYTGEITIASYYRFGVVPDSIVFDLRHVGWDASGALILGRFFAFAEEFKDREFREVRLAYKGKTKFILDGNDFSEIGRENSWQNPVYTIRTFPEKLRTPDGRRAYSSVSGGMLGVLSAQMDNVNQTTRDWYVNDMVGD